jgi:hypothetical protein
LVALLALALFALLRYRRRRQLDGAEVPPYEPEMQYHVQDPNGVAVHGENGGVNGVVAGKVVGVNGVGADKKPYPEMASEMEAKHDPQEMPEEPQRWHELESPLAVVTS